MSPRQRLPFISLISFLSLASFLRLYNLTWNSFDNDEAFSWATSHRPLLQLIEESFHMQGDPHPPVYWVMLKLWMMIAGESEVAIRSLTVFFGIIFIALTFALARKLFSPSAGVAASLFAALSSYLIWNSQDARMYIPSATLGLAGVVCLVRGLQDLSGVKHLTGLKWISYFIFTTLSCYTHLGAAFLLPLHAIIIAYSFITNRRRSIPAIISFVAVCLAFLPFALNVWNNSAVSPIGNRYAPTLDQILHNATLVLWTNYAPLSMTQQWLVVLLIGAMFLIGILFSRGSILGRLTAASYYLVPLIIIVVLSQRSPLFFPKMLVFMSPALMIGVGAGIAMLGRWRRPLGIVIGAALIALQLYGVGYIWRLGLQKEDWRNAARYIQTHQSANDLVIVHVTHYRLPFIYYFGDKQNVIAPFGSRLSSQDEIESQLKDISKYDSVWLVQTGEEVADPNRVLQNWLATRYPLATEQFPFSISVRRFTTQPILKVVPPAAKKLDSSFGDLIRLLGYEVDSTKLKTTDEWFHPPSNWIHVTLYWSVTEKPKDEFVLQVTVDDEDGKVWGGKLDRAGSLRSFYPMRSWQPNQIMREEVDLNLNPETPKGEYKIVVRLLASDGSALNVNGNDYLILTRVEITDD